MKKIITLMATIAAIFASCNGGGKTSVWKVTNGDGKIIYLGGSIHMLHEKDLPLPKQFNEAVKNSQIVVFESDDEDPNTALLAKYAVYSDSTTLRNYIDDTTYQKMLKICNNLSIPYEKVDKYKPLMATTFLSMMKMMKDGISMGSGVEENVVSMANKGNKELAYLETGQELVDVMDIGVGYEDDFINYSLLDFEKEDDNFDKSVKDWRNGSNAVYDEIKDMKTHYPKVYKRLLTDRNNLWLPKIENYLNSGKTVFVVVGVGHMWGDDGLLKLLENKGYKVEQL